MISLKANKSTVHIVGLATGEYGANAGNDTGKGYVSYFPESHCAALTRNGTRMAPVKMSRRDDAGNVSPWNEFDTPAEALKAAETYGRVYGRKVCATCAGHC